MFADNTREADDSTPDVAGDFAALADALAASAPHRSRYLDCTTIHIHPLLPVWHGVSWMLREPMQESAPC